MDNKADKNETPEIEEEPYLKETSSGTTELNQGELNFGNASETVAEENVIRHTLDMEEEEDAFKPQASRSAEQRIDRESFKRKTDERLNRLNKLTNPIHTGKNLRDYENVPAYIRKNMNLDQTPHSSESQVSRFTLSEEEDNEGNKSTGIRPNNSFLHDNVD